MRRSPVQPLLQAGRVVGGTRAEGGGRAGGPGVGAAVRLAHRQWERQAGTVTAWLAHIAESLRASDGTYTRTDIAVGRTTGQVRVRSALEDY